MPYHWKETGASHNARAGFTHDGVSYPHQWLARATPGEIEAIGLEWRAAPVFKNERWWRNTVIDGVVKSTPMDLDRLKKREVAATKRSAHSKLSSSDWMVVREAEGGADLSDAWQVYRAGVRAASNAHESAIEAAEFEALTELTPDWPRSPDEPEGGAGVIN